MQYNLLDPYRRAWVVAFVEAHESCKPTLTGKRILSYMARKLGTSPQTCKYRVNVLCRLGLAEKIAYGVYAPTREGKACAKWIKERAQ